MNGQPHDEVPAASLLELQHHVVQALRIADAFDLDEGIALDMARNGVVARMRGAGLGARVVEVPVPGWPGLG